MTKIHLLVSGFVTDESLNPSTYYGLSKYAYSKINQTISMICSISNLNFASSSFFLDYDENNLKYKTILEKFINEKIPKSIIHNYRLQYFEEWKDASKQVPLDTDLILLMTNLDHVYVAESSSAFESFCLEIIDKKEKVIGSITHWPELITSRKFKMIELGDQRNKLFLRLTNKSIGTCLVNMTCFYSWWEKDFTNGQRFVRPDNPFGPSVFSKDMNDYLPRIELFRHLDGYGHVGINSKYASHLRPCCTYSDNTIKHFDWTRKNSQKESEICNYPDYNEKFMIQNRSKYVNLVRLASAFLNNQKRNKELLSIFGVPKNEIIKIIILANIQINSLHKKIFYWQNNFNYLIALVYTKIKRKYSNLHNK